MGRPKNTVPSYCHHKSTDSARVWLNGRWLTLGRYNSPESRQEYARVVAEHAVGGVPVSANSPTVNEVLLAYLRHAEGYYRRPDGSPTHELAELKVTLRPVRELYGHTPAAEFGPLGLKAVRGRMVEIGWCRTQVNRRVGRVKRAFKWAASEQLIPPSVYHGLQTVSGLQQGRTTVKESTPVLPVDPNTVAATTPFMPRHVAGLVRFQMLTGCRPGEACDLRHCDIDKTNAVWFYNPPVHKMSYKGKPRVIAIGPRAQTLLAEFTSSAAEHVFSPRRELAELRARRKAARTARGGGSGGDKKPRADTPRRTPGERYTTASYGYAIRRAVKKANERRARLAGGGQFDLVPKWHPNQLRHLRATEARMAFGLEAAQVVLGHAKADVTQIYAERNANLAAAVALAIG